MSEPPRTIPDSHSPTPRSRKVSIMVPMVVACGFFMNQLDSTAIGTSIPQIAASFGESPLRLNVAITSYLISLAVFIPISGWIADRFGPRRVFCWAIAIFTLSSAACGFSTSLPMLVAARIVQGFGGALMNPVGRLILIRSFPKGELLGALSLVSIPALIGPTIGPVVGGFITSTISWHWIFFINLPIGAVGIALALRYIRDFPVPRPPRFDFRGFALVASGLVLLELGIEYLGRNLVPAWAEVALFTAAGLLLALYVLHAQLRPDPVLDLNLFKLRVFRIAWTSGGICHVAIGALPFLLPLMLQVGFGLDPLRSGLLTFVTGIGAIMMKTVATRVARIFGFRRLLVYNSILLGAMIGGIGLFDPSTPHWLLLLYLFTYGIVRATQFTNIQALGYADLTPPIMSKGTSMASIIQQLCNSFGVALAASILAMATGPLGHITLADFRLVFATIAILPIISMFGFLRLRPRDGAEVSGSKTPDDDRQRANGDD